MKKNYDAVSLIYGHMMREINYHDWALYIFDLIDSFNKEPDAMLELSSGNCKLANSFKKYHKNIIASDLSFEMLANSSENKLAKVVCDMKSMPFASSFDVIISTFDSINYLLTEEEIKKTFTEVKNILSKDGYFLFDVSLENNSINNVKSLNRKGKVDGIKYVQESIYDNVDKIHYNKFNIKLPDGTYFSEEHQQRIYDFFFFFEAAEETGLFVKECYECFTFQDANPETERAQFVLRKF